MKIYLATPHSYKEIFKMKLYLSESGGILQSYIEPTGLLKSKDMKVYLAGDNNKKMVMEVYLAMGAGGNSACYKEHNIISGEYLKESKMKLHLAGPHCNQSGDKNLFKKDTDIYLASDHNIRKSKEYLKLVEKEKIYVLESFYYIKDWMIPYIKNHWHFLLDSGAFTFMSNTSKKLDWDSYTEKYAKFINNNDIKLFFELDIDSIVGIKEVERLRTKLEKLTNKQCIPVWHKSRGKEYWLQMIKDYDYVAIGGIVTKEIRPKHYPFFTWLLSEAKKENCKVHGLGFTNLKKLQKYKFYSVDSTSWIYGNRGGFLYHFNGRTMEQIQSSKTQRIKSKSVAIHNFKEWIKFQKYALKNL